MGSDSTPPATSQTLLGRLRHDPTDQAAWDDFVNRYGRTIYRWGRTWGLQEADAEDMTQAVLLRLARQMSGFEYDPNGSFRGWLKTVAYRSWCDFLDTRKRTTAGSGDSAVLQLLDSVPARDELIQKLDDEYDRELLEKAMARVQLRVQDRTWDAFRMTALESVPGAEAAAALHMTPGAVYVARSKVQKMIQEEIQEIESRR
jgi:RNA polymerase sigma factor (sigma-70 family)